MQEVKTILADNQAIFVEGLKCVLAGNANWKFDIVGIAYDGESLISQIKAKDVDLLILDLNMPGKDGLQVIEYVRTANLDVKILTLSMYNNPKIVKSVMKLGADGYVLKENKIQEVFEAVEEVMAGNVYYGDGVSLTKATTHKSSLNGNHTYVVDDQFIRKYSLTKREIEILQLITQALSNKEIAKELYISDQTVSVHRKNIMRKLGVSNTAGLIKVAYDNSLV